MFRSAKWIVVAFLSVSSFLAPGSAMAQTPKTLDPVVATATRAETPQAEIGSSVTVVTDDEVKTYHYQSVDEALRNVPGVDIQRSSGIGKLTSLRIRGAGPAQVQVMIDGVRVKSPTSGDFDLSDISVDLIDRIEVVRGPQATLYGADAIGGVVNIITKQGQGRPAGSVSVEAGNYGTFRERISVTGSVKRFDFALSASRLDSAGRFDNDDAGQTALGGRFGVMLPLDGRLSLILRYAKSETDLPIKSTFPQTTLDPNAQQQTELTVVALQWEQKFFRWWEQQLQLSGMWNNLGFQNPPDPPATGAGVLSQIDTRRRGVEWLHRFHIEKIDTVTIGVEWQDENGENAGTFDKTIITRSLFLQNELRLFERLFLTAGVRFDDNSAFGSKVTPRVAVAYLIKKLGTKLKASYGEGFRAPTINDLFFPGFGNTNLKPEESRSWDAGFEQKLWENRVRFGATYFRNRFDNLIQFVFTPPATFLPENVGRALTEGMEAFFALEPIDTLLFTVNYTLLRTEDLDTGLPLRRFPRNRWNIGLSYDPVKRLNLFTQIYLAGSQFESASQGRNPGHERVDVGGTLRLLDQFGYLKNLELTSRVQNLFNRNYAEVFGFPALGVNYLFGLRGSFN